MGQTGQRSIVEDRPCGRMRRLPPAFYQGYAFVHWNMTLQERSCGWLSPAFHQRFREIQLHTLSRYRLFCLCYCLMPDHLHLLWAGLDADSDQDKAATFFRKYLNRALAEAGAARLSAPGDEETTLSQTGAGSGSAARAGAPKTSLGRGASRARSCAGCRRKITVLHCGEPRAERPRERSAGVGLFG